MKSVMFAFQVICVYLIRLTSADGIFSSSAHLQSSVKAQYDLSQHILSYVELQTTRLANLTSLATELQNFTQKLLDGNMDRHLGNPVNAYLIIKTMADMLSKIYNQIEQEELQNHKEYLKSLSDNQSMLPNNEDVDGAISALLRLQDTYDLDTKQLSDGNLGLKEPQNEAPPLTGFDCFNIARSAYASEDFYHAVMWLQEALVKLESEDDLDGMIPVILEYLNFAYYKQGNIEWALWAANKWLEYDQESEVAANNKIWYENHLAASDISFDSNNLPPLNNQRNRTGYHSTLQFKQYEILCQGKQLPAELLVGRKPPGNLQCHYEPVMFSYVPAEVEILMDEPRLVFYHHILTEDDIKFIMELSQPKLHRSGVFAVNAPTPAGGIKTTSRVSKSAWLWDYEHNRLASLTLRASRITGLSIEHAEAFQVLNYGIGGHYEPHHDFARSTNPDVFAEGAGNRLATFILYLSDVEKGGATVFPHLGAAVWPEKGGAAFWFNLDRNGQPDERTLHGACPVLAGYKWVSNKWFHETGNEELLTCGL